MTWTEGRKRSFVVSTLRGGMRRYPPKWTVLKAASVGKKLNKLSNRITEHYLCNGCKQEFPAKEVQVDHILPVVDPDVGFVSWDTFIERMYCEESNLQVLCKTCHKIKTKEENKRKVNANSKKHSKE